MPQLSVITGDEELDKIISERDNLRRLATALRHVVVQLANYLLNCENELNNTLVDELLKMDIYENKVDDNSLKITILSDMSSDDEKEPVSLDKSLTRPKRVHFAQDVSHILDILEDDSILDYAEKSRDISIEIGNKLKSSLDRLKFEAAALLGLSTMRNKDIPTFEGRRLSSMTRQLIEEKKSKDDLNNKLQENKEIILKYEQELSDIRAELNELIEHQSKEKIVAAASSEIVYASPLQARIHKVTHLQDKARGLLAEKGECPSKWLQVIEELCIEGDNLVEDIRRDKEDLQQQVEAADKQLRNTRAFLEEQAAERELERDESNKEIVRLQEMLKERERDWTTKERFATEGAVGDVGKATSRDTMETLEQQIKETTELLKITEEKKNQLETELKAAADKIWVLRDIISEQEVQVSQKSEREATLAQRLDELETELEKQNQAQHKMLNELETLRESGGDPALLEQLHHLKEQLKKQPNSSTVRQMKHQLREMGKSVDKLTKELELLNIHGSSASLSSPSEDISIREQIESWRCDTPEDRDRMLCGGSPPAPIPTEDVNKLHDKLLKLSRVKETVMKKLKDQQMQLSTVQSHFEDIQAERDVLQQQCDKQLVQIASVTSRLDEMRIRTDREQTASNVQLNDKIRKLENKNKNLMDKINSLQKENTSLKENLNHAQNMVSSQDVKLRSCIAPKQEIIDGLQRELFAMQEEKQKLETVVAKYRSTHNISLPSLIEMLLAEKNAELDQLQERVSQFQESISEQSRIHPSVSANSKGHRVSFASDLMSGYVPEDERLRSAAPDASLQVCFNSLSMGDMGQNDLALREIQKNVSSVAEPDLKEENIHNITSERIIQLETELFETKCLLKEKIERVKACESQLPLMEQELQTTKEELVSTLSAITEDKKYYQEQLQTLSNTQKSLYDKEEEVEQLKTVLARKEEDIVKMKADVHALQMILDKLQDNLKEAKKFVAENENNKSTIEIDKLRNEVLELNEQNNILLKNVEKLTSEANMLKQIMESEKSDNLKLNEVLKNVENEKKLCNEELNVIKANCEIYQSQLKSSLKRIEEEEIIIKTLKEEVVNITDSKNKLSFECTNLKAELDRITIRHNADVSNLAKKCENEVLQLKEEVKELQNLNTNLKENCNILNNKLKQHLYIQGLMTNNKERLKQLESDVKQLEDTNSCLREEKRVVEQRFESEVNELKMLMNDLNENIKCLKISEKEYQQSLGQEKEVQNMISRKYEILLQDCEKQKRIRKEIEKKYLKLKQDLDKEKKYVGVLEEQMSGRGKKSINNLRITVVDVFEIKSDSRCSDMLDDLAVKLQKELFLSEQLDKSIMSGYQQEEDVVGQRTHLPAVVEHLKRKLAEVEESLQIEKMTVNELRAQMGVEARRYEKQVLQIHHLIRQEQLLRNEVKELEDKNDKLRYCLEAEKAKQVHFEKMMRPSPEVVAKKEVEEERKKLSDLYKKYQTLKTHYLANEKELELLRNFPKLQSLGVNKNHEEISSDNLVDGEHENAVIDQLKMQLEKQKFSAKTTIQNLHKVEEEKESLKRKIEQLEVELEHCKENEKRNIAKLKSMESIERRRSRRNRSVVEESGKQLEQILSDKNVLEQENTMLKLQLKQNDLQLQAIASKTPLKLKLNEAKTNLRKLVAEKEEQHLRCNHLQEQNEILNNVVKKLRQENETLKQQLNDNPNILVTDGLLEDINAKYASERAAWLKEKETLQNTLAQTANMNPISLSDFDANLHHILCRYLRAESYRKSLVWQKTYLLIVLKGYETKESGVIDKLKTIVGPKCHETNVPSPSVNKFKVAALTVIAITRMFYLIERRSNMHHSTSEILRDALTNSKKPMIGLQKTEQNNKYQRLEDLPSLKRSLPTPITPGCVSEYMERFNEMQNRIRLTLASNNT